MKKSILIAFMIIVFCSLIYKNEASSQIKVELYDVYEVDFNGENYQTKDNPVRDIELVTTWQHEPEGIQIRIYGFYDGDGKGGNEGDCFKVRFCPVKTGKWVLKSVESNDRKLVRQHEGLELYSVDSPNKGFWEVDENSNGGRWYKRSDGSHEYIVGNTLYTFLSETFKGKPTGGSIEKDVLGNAKYYNKLRFALTGDLFPHPTFKPFLDIKGNPTDDGNYSYRPNPTWFHNRVDLAVRLSFEEDMIADLILNGPDSENGRSNLNAGKNNGDYSPWLRYIAARYCSYPNVWLCLSNEYDIRKPSYLKTKVVQVGSDMKKILAYPTPLSVHGNNGNWNDQLNGNWHDHIIVQNKIKKMDKAADCNNLNYWIGGKKPVVNDELAYEGEGDGWSGEDVIGAILGSFVGGGYASTGYKSGN
jgi:hypothetical protein